MIEVNYKVFSIEHTLSRGGGGGICYKVQNSLRFPVMAVVFTLLPVILAGYRNHTTFYIRSSQPIVRRQYVARDGSLYWLRRRLK